VRTARLDGYPEQILNKLRLSFHITFTTGYVGCSVRTSVRLLTLPALRAAADAALLREAGYDAERDSDGKSGEEAEKVATHEVCSFDDVLVEAATFYAC
jgi:hypothetical protein